MSRSSKVKLDGMLMVGSAERNTGKTKLACELIERFSKKNDIIGIKVTTVSAKNGKCPRGGDGCGVCTSLDGNFSITQESNSRSVKDTGRLLAAGASKVFWLRVLKAHLAEGLEALLDVMGRDAVSVCESNSLRQVVEPALFFMTSGRDLESCKSSARHMRKYADRIVVFDGRDFDFDLGRIKLAGNKWIMPEQATAIILAGGGSRRMRVDKSMLTVKGRPLIEAISEQLRDCFKEILISANEAEKLAFLGFKIIPDKIRGQGPLMGIASALEASGNELNFVTACDIPHINIPCVRRMLAEAGEADIVIPTTGEGKYEPLFAVYRKSTIRVMNEVLSGGGRKISDIFSRCRVKYIDLGEARWFVNLNTKAEYEEFQKSR